MTVAQLIRKLQKMPQDALVTMSNNDCYINGEYTVEICTDYERNLTYEDIWEDLTKKVEAILMSIKERVRVLTNTGLYVWEIARVLHISEAKVVKLQGRA